MIRFQPDQLLGGDPNSVGIGACPTRVDPQIVPFGPAELLQFLQERGEPGPSVRILLQKRHQRTDAARLIARLLREGGTGAYDRTGERYQETASLHDYSLSHDGFSGQDQDIERLKAQSARLDRE
jgi:hypothetical protein